MNHKKMVVILLVLVAVTGYVGYRKLTSPAGEVRYITASVEKGILIASISGSGQVSAQSQIDVKAKASGDVAYVSLRDGQWVALGGHIATLDVKDAQKSVRDAEVNVESSKIALEKLRIEKSKENMNADLAKSYDDGFNAVANVFLDLPDIMTGVDDMFFNSTESSNQSNIEWYITRAHSSDSAKALVYKQNFLDSFEAAEKAYEANFEKYKLASRKSESSVIEEMILETYETLKLAADAVKNANNYIDFINDSISEHNLTVPSVMATHKATLNSYTGDTNAHLVALLTAKTDIKDYRDSFVSADLDIQSALLTLKQKENALQDAKEKLSDYFIRAPFEGTITKINVKKSDTVSAGTIVATLITRRQLAEISMNEVDVAKVKVGQKATLTFDAIPDLTIAGTVADIDASGTVSQGVVTYMVKVSFDTQDERIKPGMSVTSAVITNKKEAVLIVPNSAIKSQAGTQYVEINTPIPTKVPVETGISNDTETEIISGLNEGDTIITRTVTVTGETATAAPSLFGSGPASRGGGGNVRLQAR